MEFLRFPLGDRLAWFDSLSIINEIHSIMTMMTHKVTLGKLILACLGISQDLPIAPKVFISFENIETRNEQESQVVSIAFSSTIQDTDSYSFSYSWDFGDGGTSQLSDPIHDYFIQDDHSYSVLPIVEDEFGQRGYASAVVNIDQGNSSFPIRLNFVGDIMMETIRKFRWYHLTKGLALFEPTINLLGNAADLTIANLEIPLTDQDTPILQKVLFFEVTLKM